MIKKYLSACFAYKDKRYNDKEINCGINRAYFVRLLIMLAMSVSDCDIEICKPNFTGDLDSISKITNIVTNDLQKCKKIMDTIAGEAIGCLVVEGQVYNLVMDMLWRMDGAISSLRKLNPAFFRAYVRLIISQYKIVLDELSSKLEDFQGFQKGTYLSFSIMYDERVEYWRNRINNRNVPDKDKLLEAFDIKLVNKQMFEESEKIYHSMNICIQYIKGCLSDLSEGIDENVSEIDGVYDGAIVYWQEKRDSVERLLKTQLWEMEWKRDSNEDAWCKLMQREVDVIDAVIKATECPTIDGYDFIFMQKMFDSQDLLREYKKSISYGSLYDLKERLEKDFTVLFSLNYSNLYLFYELTLRFNIIMYHIYPELKPRFDAWINGRKDSFDAKDNTKGEETVLKIGARSKIKTIEELMGFIRKWFVDDLKYAYDWYALFRFLDDNGYLKDGNVKKFSEEMNRLFTEAKKRCDRTTLGNYKSLLGGSVEKWSSLSDEEIKKVKKTRKNGVYRNCSIYNIIKERHDAL